LTITLGFGPSTLAIHVSYARLSNNGVIFQCKGIRPVIENFLIELIHFNADVLLYVLGRRLQRNCFCSIPKTDEALGMAHYRDGFESHPFSSTLALYGSKWAARSVRSPIFLSQRLDCAIKCWFFSFFGL